MRREVEWLVWGVAGVVLTAAVLIVADELGRWLWEAGTEFDFGGARMAAIGWIAFGVALGALFLWKHAHPLLFAVPAVALITLNSALLFLTPENSVPNWIADLALQLLGDKMQLTLLLAGVFLAGTFRRTKGRSSQTAREEEPAVAG